MRSFYQCRFRQVVFVLCLKLFLDPAKSQPINLLPPISETDNGVSSEIENTDVRLGNQKFQEENDSSFNSYDSNRISNEGAFNSDQVNSDSAFWSNNSNLMPNAYQSPLVSAERSGLYPVAMNSSGYSGTGAIYASNRIQQPMDYPGYSMISGTVNNSIYGDSQLSGNSYGLITGGKVQSHPFATNVSRMDSLPMSAYQLYSNSNAKSGYVKSQPLTMSGSYDPNPNVGNNMAVNSQGMMMGYKQGQSNPVISYGDKIFQQSVPSVSSGNPNLVSAAQNAFQQFSNASRSMSGERGYRDLVRNERLQPLASMMSEQNPEVNAEALNLNSQPEVVVENEGRPEMTLVPKSYNTNVKLRPADIEIRLRREMNNNNNNNNIKQKIFSVDEAALIRNKRRPEESKGLLTDLLKSVRKNYDVRKIGTDANLALLHRKNVDSVSDRKPLQRRDTFLQSAPSAPKIDPVQDKFSEVAGLKVPLGAPNRLRRGSASPCLCTSKISVNAVVPCSTPSKMTTCKTTQGRQQRPICTTKCVLNVLIPCKSNTSKSLSADAQEEMAEKQISGSSAEEEVSKQESGKVDTEVGTENKEEG